MKITDESTAPLITFLVHQAHERREDPSQADSPLWEDWKQVGMFRAKDTEDAYQRAGDITGKPRRLLKVVGITHRCP